MRLAFICSGLEPGRDGIGDFARTLAAACAAAGHESRLVAVRDTFCGGEVKGLRPSYPEPRFRDIFRYPGEMRSLAAWFRDFQPQWVSVQFTPFGFHQRGLGARRASDLRALLSPLTQRHLMLHETWLQPGPEGSWRHRILGRLQRRSVLSWLTSGWQPDVIHTQARLHLARLHTRGIPAQLLPLCTAFTSPSASLAEARALLAPTLRDPAGAKTNVDASALWIGHFGTLHREGWDFPSYAAKLAAIHSRRICFLALGRARAISQIWAAAARAVPQADFRLLGELPADKVTLAMRACDAAITSTPWDIIEKSSAVAAWRAVGVPVLVTRGPAPHNGDLPPWPDAGLLLANEVGPKLAGPFQNVPGPPFLSPAHAAGTFLSALAANGSTLA